MNKTKTDTEIKTKSKSQLQSQTKNQASYCGFISIIGRPNVGKSTLINALIGAKVSITARKAQTTRHQILGIQTIEQYQMVYIDTPGIHPQLNPNKSLNHYLNRTALSVLADVDLVLWLFDGQHWTKEEDDILDSLSAFKRPIIAVINKIDKIKDKTELLPVMQRFSELGSMTAVVPISAKKQKNLEILQQHIFQLLPQQAHIFPKEQWTDRSERFLVSEIIREKLTRYLGQELPYELNVEIERFQQKNTLMIIEAVIYVMTDGQKKIVIGKKGEGLKIIGKKARQDIESLLETQVLLKLWVKVKKIVWFQQELQ